MPNLSIGRSTTLQSAEFQRYYQTMSESVFYPRYVEPRLAEMLEDSQAVLIHGPRQCDNTTLAQFVYASDYLKLGDDSILCSKDRFTSGTPRQNFRDFTYISFDDAIE